MARTIVRGPLNFTASDGTTLETLYSYFALITGTSTGYVGIKSNALTQLFGDVGVRYVYRDGSGTYTADQYSGGVIAGLGGFTFGYIGLTVRVSADTGSGADYYLLRIQDIAASGGNQATDIIKCVNGSSSTLDTRNISWSNGDAIFIEAVDNGGSVDLKVYQGTGSTPRYTVTDSTSPLASGKPGTSSEQGTTLSWDNVELGTIGAASTTHAATGALAAGAATVAGTAARNATHTSSGALAAGAAVVAGTANHLTSHAATGALTAGAATVAGAAARTGAVVSFTTEAFMNNTETPLASTAVDWTWHAGGVIGSTGGTLTHGSGTTNGSGVLVATGMSAGAGYLLATDGVGHVYYEEGTAA